MALVLRSIGLIVCGTFWWWLTKKGSMEKIPGGVLTLLASYGVLIVFSIMMAKPIVGWIGDLMANLFMPGARNDKPQPMYSIPEGRLSAEDYAGAIEAYAELAAEHPTEIAPHLRMMEIYIRVYQDPDSARQIQANARLSIKGRKNLRNFETASALILAEVA